MEEIKGRYIFPGNLKLPVSIIKNSQISETRLRQMIDVLDGLKDRCLSRLTYGKDTCYEVVLTKTRSLYIDYKKNVLNFYIYDSHEKVYTQVLTVKDCEIIERRERNILSKLESYTRGNLQLDTSKGSLVQTLMRVAYEQRSGAEHTKRVLGNKIEDDFNLDI